MRRPLKAFTVLAALLLTCTAAAGAASQAAPAGRVLGPARGQVAWLGLEAPGLEPVTALQRPANPADISAAPNLPYAVASIVTPFAGSGPPGMDLSMVDLESGDVTPVLERETAAESLDLPVLTPDGAAVVFQRSLIQSVQPTYVTRIDRIGVDGSNRTVVIEDGRSPALAPDGRTLAYVRVSSAGVELRFRSFDGSERAVVPAGRFVAIAYPRFSPDGQQLAFAAITELRSPFRGAPGTSLIGAPLGHGYPYEIWLMGADGQNLREVPDAINDDPSVTWSPDGTLLLVYGGWGSLLIDVASGEQTALPFLAGYGSLAWLP